MRKKILVKEKHFFFACSKLERQKTGQEKRFGFKKTSLLACYCNLRMTLFVARRRLIMGNFTSMKSPLNDLFVSIASLLHTFTFRKSRQLFVMCLKNTQQLLLSQKDSDKKRDKICYQIMQQCELLFKISRSQTDFLNKHAEKNHFLPSNRVELASKNAKRIPPLPGSNFQISRVPLKNGMAP